MNDGSRASEGPSDAAEAFAIFVVEWLRQEAAFDACLHHGPLPDLNSRVGRPGRKRLNDSWELWEEYAGIDRGESARRLSRYLDEGLVYVLSRFSQGWAQA